MTDKDIVHYLRQNNYNKATKGLYTFYPTIKKYIVANSGSNEDAQDLFQDALVILYKKVQASDFQLQSSLQTYITGIAKNVWMQELRRKKKFDTTTLEEKADETIVDDTEKYSIANAAFNLLGEKCKQLLILFYYKKQSFKQIATALAFSDENTAKNQKYRCLQKAKENYVTLIKE